jgi:hypothetical protein
MTPRPDEKSAADLFCPVVPGSLINSNQPATGIKRDLMNTYTNNFLSGKD